MTRILSICVSFCVLVFGVNADLELENNGPLLYPTDYSYTVSIMQNDNNYHLCGGAIIGPQTILTAAQCIDGIEISNLKVFTGGDELAPNSTTTSTILKIAKNDMNEIAILTLTEILDLDSIGRRVINLPSEQYLPGIGVVFTGWGSTENNSRDRSYFLMKMEVQLADISQCQQFKFPLSQKSYVCTLPGHQGQGICDGDYGGPLVAVNEIIGVAAFTGVCGKSPSVYFNVYSHLKFIETETGIVPQKAIPGGYFTNFFTNDQKYVVYNN